MDQQETIALLERCELLKAGAKEMALAAGKPETGARAIGQEAARSAWNEWAQSRLAELNGLKKAGAWSVKRDGFGELEARNDETRIWLHAAKADFSGVRFVKRPKPNEVRLDLGDVSSRAATPAWDNAGVVGVLGDDADFSGFVFPGLADFSSTQFNVAVHFTEARFYGEGRFRNARFSRPTWFDQAQLSGEAQFHRAQFTGPVWFRGARFQMSADFEKAEFTREAWFDEALFSDRARFGAAQFSGEVRFHKVEFSGSATFIQTEFANLSWFDQAQFFADAQFVDTHFGGKSWFREARFSDEAVFRTARFFVSDFQKAQFLGEARFHGAQFSGETNFGGAAFSGDCSFTNARLAGNADFERASFAGNLSFAGAELDRPALFTQARFGGDTFFSDARFGDLASFRLAVFSSFATFEGARFAGPATFNALRGGRAFDLNGASFACAPDFIQAHFDEAPRLDNLAVSEKAARTGQGMAGGVPLRAQPSHAGQGPLALIYRLLFPDREAAARWRALKRLAIQAHDHEREQIFFANEIRALRFAWDKPLPWPIWRAEGWGRFARFWLGVCYSLFANYGRSAFLPVLWWAAAVVLATLLYLGEHDQVAQRRAALITEGVHWSAARLRSGYEAWRAPEPCVVPAESRSGVSALAPAARGETNAAIEATELALRTGLLVFDPGPDNARRTLGCLYGVEHYGETAAAIVPPAVSRVMIAQKLFCALMIFLFALAVRNMLRMR
jgi:hypothetical protein